MTRSSGLNVHRLRQPQGSQDQSRINQRSYARMQRPSSNLQDVTNQSKRQRLSLDGDPVFSGASKPYSSTTNPHTRHASVDSTVSHQRRGPPRSENIPPNHQKRPTSAAPEININLHLAHPKWGLSKEFITGLRNCGIEEMYEWQAECLSVEGLLQGESNLVYSAPASAGKCLGVCGIIPPCRRPDRKLS